jgi:hypothetical protein
LASERWCIFEVWQANLRSQGNDVYDNTFIHFQFLNRGHGECINNALDLVFDSQINGFNCPDYKRRRDRSCGPAFEGGQSCCAKQIEGSGLIYTNYIGEPWSAVQPMCDTISNALSVIPGFGSFSCWAAGDDAGIPMSGIQYSVEYHDYGDQINTIMQHLFPPGEPPSINGFNCPDFKRRHMIKRQEASCDGRVLTCDDAGCMWLCPDESATAHALAERIPQTPAPCDGTAEPCKEYLVDCTCK